MTGKDRNPRGSAALRSTTLLALVGLVAGGLGLMGCSDSNPAGQDDGIVLWELDQCDFEQSYLVDGGIGIDGLPALNSPILVDTTARTEITYLSDDSRVIGFVVSGQPIAIPLGALWYHEVANLNHGNSQLVVTHGTFSGSSRVYERSAVGGVNFGVSGLLYQNNLLLYDRSEGPSLWSQLTGKGRCGPRSGSSLTPYPSMEVTWEGWTSLYPNTLVLSTASATTPFWGQYPYGAYQETTDFFFTTAMPTLDSRRPPKERVLGIPDGGQGGIAFPFGAFPQESRPAVANGEVGGEKVVVFWRGDMEGAAAYWAEGGGQVLTFEVRDGEVVDQETGSTWSFLGVGSGGGLDGVRLDPVREALVAYWGVWAAFQPNTEVWEEG